MSAGSRARVEYDWAAVLFGLFVAPPAAGLVLGVLITFTGLFPALIFAPLFAALVGWPVAFLFGIPLYVILRRRRVTWWGAYVGAAMLLGLGGGVALAIAPRSTCDAGERCAELRIPFLDDVSVPGFGGLIGGIAGLVFWRAVRPDHLQAQSAALAGRRAWLEALARVGVADATDGGAR